MGWTRLAYFYIRRVDTYQQSARRYHKKTVTYVQICLLAGGAFPSLISIITMFFTASAAGAMRSGLSALILLAVILGGVLMTLFVSWILSKTVLKGVPSSFALELPPYRKPQIGKVIVRSIFDRTIFVLGRACAVAAPAGLLIWCLANFTVSGETILFHLSEFLQPLGNILGMDGVILLGFIQFHLHDLVVILFQNTDKWRD